MSTSEDKKAEPASQEDLLGEEGKKDLEKKTDEGHKRRGRRFRRKRAV